MCGRFVTGLGVGLGLAIDPVYIAEVSPPKHRGRLVTWSETATNVGILLGFVSGFAFRNAGEVGWRAMLRWGAVIPSMSVGARVYVHAGPRAASVSSRRGACRAFASVASGATHIAAKSLPAPTRRWRLDWRRRDAIDATHHQRSHDAHDAPAPRAGVAALASSEGARSEEAKLISARCYPPSSNVDAVVAAIQAAITEERNASNAYGWSALLWRPTKTTKSCSLWASAWPCRSRRPR